MTNLDFGVEQVTRYLNHVDRRLYILPHSGVDWKPEYKKELAGIDDLMAGTYFPPRSVSSGG